MQRSCCSGRSSASRTTGSHAAPESPAKPCTPTSPRSRNSSSLRWNARREIADVDTGIDAVYAAPTATDALDALVELHGSFVPRFLRAHLAVERERASDPDVETAFANRSTGLRQLAAHIATRLHAEGDLVAPWTVESAAELIRAVTSGTFTAQLLHDAQWTTEQVGDRVRLLLRRTLLDNTKETS